ncbi:MAG: hypothetical protein IJ365_00415 [Clostridia bacterium]|nr:hypothetical protein [Clostridia bacterium]
MIDLHTHILPGIDDGAKDVSQSVQMLMDSYSQGVTLCAATPHCCLHADNSVDEFLAKRDEAYSQLMQNLSNLQVPRIITGAEVYMDNDISRYDGIERLCIGGSRFMLVEFPFTSFDPEYSEWLYNLNLKEIIPVIAHIDRYDYHDDLIASFSGVRIVYQVNNIRAHDIRGRRFIKKLLGTGYMVIMSSDMHNTDTRPCDMKKSYDVLCKRMPKYADDLYINNAGIIIENCVG